MDGPPVVVVDGVGLVGARAFAEACGATTAVNGKQVRLIRHQRSFICAAGTTEAMVEMLPAAPETIALALAPRLIDDRLYVPLRPLVEAWGGSISLHFGGPRLEVRLPQHIPIILQLQPPPTLRTYKPPTSAEIDATKQAGTRRVIMRTARGSITLDLYGNEAPRTVANFLKLAKAGFYDGLTFHRVETIPGFCLIQGGCPGGNGTGDPGYSIKLEIAPTLRHDAGVIAMARSSDPDSAGSQFYITRAPIHQLDDQYAVFGQVTGGLDVVRKIRVGDRIESVRPLAPAIRAPRSRQR